MANEIETPMEPSGRVLPLFRGEYADNVVYENPDIVLYNNSSYVAKQTTIGNPPPTDALSNDYWQMVAKGIIDADVSEATVEFKETSKRENIESGETLSTIICTIKKWLKDLKPIAFNGTTDSKTVSTPGQYAADAVQLNPSIPGTLASELAKSFKKSGDYGHLFFNSHDVNEWRTQGCYSTIDGQDIHLPDKQTYGLAYHWGTIVVFENKNCIIQIFNQWHARSVFFWRSSYNNVWGDWSRPMSLTDINSSSAITEAGKYALDAREKNPTIPGTLANSIGQINSDLENDNLNYYYVPGGNDGNIFDAFIGNLDNIKAHPKCFGHSTLLEKWLGYWVYVDTLSYKATENNPDCYVQRVSGDIGHAERYLRFTDITHTTYYWSDWHCGIIHHKITDGSTVTEERMYVADARQLNPSIEGTLANKIAKLNDNLRFTSFNEIDITNGNSDKGGGYCILGNIVCIYVKCKTVWHTLAMYGIPRPASTENANIIGINLSQPDATPSKFNWTDLTLSVVNGDNYLIIGAYIKKQ